jgi:hypothetical protein
MKTLRYLLRSINLINIVFAAAVIFFADYMVLPFFNKGVRVTPPVAGKTLSQDSISAEKPADEKTPSPSDYMIIADQNLFHPERKIPVPKVEAPPLPKPDFVLYGTLMTGDLKIAYMEDKKSPQSTPGREKRQTPLKIGDSMSGFTLKEIDKDRVMMQRGEEKMVVALENPLHPKSRESVTAPGAPAVAPGAPGVRQPGVGNAPASMPQPAPAPSQVAPNNQQGPPPQQQPPSPARRRRMWGGSQTLQ